MRIEQLENIARLIKKRQENTLEEQERAELEEWMAAGEANRKLSGDFNDATILTQELRQFYAVPRENISRRIEAAFPPRVISFRKWFRYAAALLLIAGTATFLYIKSKPPKELTILHVPDKSPGIQPGGNKAMLTLSDGSTILLDSAANGSVAQQGSTKIIKLDAGSLAYDAGETNGNELLYNTISTPRGGQYQVVLSDGSKVWLNAASSVKFPATFTRERTVTITGEVFFEITPDKQSPFKVIINDYANIEVLGTAFNVNAYTDESIIKTTLTEGLVRIHANGQSQLLKPEQQAQISASSGIQLIKKADISKVTAWKNGLLDFEGSDVKEVMRQISRWYDVDVVYEKGIPDIRFIGKIPKQLPLSSLIRTLEENGVHIRIGEKKQLIVTP